MKSKEQEKLIRASGNKQKSFFFYSTIAVSHFISFRKIGYHNYRKIDTMSPKCS